jgi:hypothetical protein
MTSLVELRAPVTETQAQRLQQRLTTIPFKVQYHEEQHGSALIACITCTASQERMLRDLLNEVGAMISAASDNHSD